MLSDRHRRSIKDRGASLSGRFLISAAALAIWNLFVWGGRLRNLVAEPGPVGDANRWSLVGSVGFIALAVATLGAGFALQRAARGARPGPVAGLVTGLASVMAGVGIVVWSYRAVVIAVRDYSLGFIVVHSVLAVTTIALGLAVLGSLRPRSGGSLSTAGEGR